MSDRIRTLTVVRFFQLTDLVVVYYFDGNVLLLMDKQKTETFGSWNLGQRERSTGIWRCALWVDLVAGVWKKHGLLDLVMTVFTVCWREACENKMEESWLTWRCRILVSPNDGCVSMGVIVCECSCCVGDRINEHDVLQLVGLF